MNSGLTSHQQRGHTETGPRFKVSSERPEKRGIDLATPGLVVQRVIHYTTAAPEIIIIIIILPLPQNANFSTEYFPVSKVYTDKGGKQKLYHGLSA